MASPSYVPPSHLDPIDLGDGIAWAVYWGQDMVRTPVSIIRADDGRELWLSTRQVQVLALCLALGRKEAAFRLGISVATVRNHLTAVNRIMGTTTQTEAAMALGWLKLPRQLDPLLDDAPRPVRRHGPAHGGGYITGRRSRSLRATGRLRRLVGSTR